MYTGPGQRARREPGREPSRLLQPEPPALRRLRGPQPSKPVSGAREPGWGRWGTPWSPPGERVSPELLRLPWRALCLMGLGPLAAAHCGAPCPCGEGTTVLRPPSELSPGGGRSVINLVMAAESAASVGGSAPSLALPMSDRAPLILLSWATMVTAFGPFYD